MSANSICRVGPVEIGSGKLALIAGPCVAESADLCMSIAERLAGLCERLGIAYVFKASFDKANRSSLDSYRGPGLERGLEILASVRERHQVPILTDVHEVGQVERAAAVADRRRRLRSHRRDHRNRHSTRMTISPSSQQYQIVAGRA